MFWKIFIKNLRNLCSFLLSLFIDVISRKKNQNATGTRWEKNCKVISMKNLLLRTKPNMQVLICNMTRKLETFKAKVYIIIE